MILRSVLYPIDDKLSASVASARTKVPTPSATSCPKANSDHSPAFNMITYCLAGVPVTLLSLFLGAWWLS